MRNASNVASIQGMGGRGPMRGRPVVKPKDLKGTLSRLWILTSGNRKGLGWILLLSACSSASAILSPLVIGDAVNAVDKRLPAVSLLLLLLSLYLCDWIVRFLQQFFMASIGQKMIHHIRVALFEAMKTLPLAFLTGNSTEN